MEPGVYFDLDMRDYHAAPAVNARLLQTIVDRCPAAAYFESWHNPARIEAKSSTMDAGAIAHSILLEGGCKRVEIIDPFDFPAKTTGAIPEGYTNKDIRAARDNAYACGKIPILKHAFAEVEAMVAAARLYIDSLKHDEPAIYEAFEPMGGDSEASIFWREDGGTLCRIRPDRLNKARSLCVDYKTGDTSAEPNTWGRTQMIRMGYYTAAAFYQRGIRAAFGKVCEYIFLVQEKDPPYLCSLVGVDEQGFALGDSKIKYGLDLWRKCDRARNWPSYPTRVCYAAIPPWESGRWEEFEALGIPYDPGKLWEKPAKESAA